MKKKNRKHKNAEHLKIVNARKEIEKHDFGYFQLKVVLYFLFGIIGWSHYVDTYIHFLPFILKSSFITSVLFICYFKINNGLQKKISELHHLPLVFSLLYFSFWLVMISSFLLILNGNIYSEKEQVHQLKVEGWFVKKSKRSTSRVAKINYSGFEDILRFNSYSIHQLKTVEEVILVTRKGILGYESLQYYSMDTSKINKEPEYFYNTNR